MGDTKTAVIEIVGGPNCGEIFQSDSKHPQRFFSIRNVCHIRCDHDAHDPHESDDGVVVSDPFTEWTTYEKRHRNMTTGYWIFTPQVPAVKL